MSTIVPAIIVGYTIGSLPIGYVIAHAAAGIDLRRAGSGNVGTANAYRTAGLPSQLPALAGLHHERFDGSGYPQGLKGDAILPEARVLAVADVLESMASHRPYRASLGVGVALAEIERGRGSAYDAQVVDCCLRLFREKAFVIPA